MNKYHNVKTQIDGHTFASKREAGRYNELFALWEAGEINSLRLQPEFVIFVMEHRICKYIADFEYYTLDGKRVIEDAKGVKTAIYQLKKKLMLACYGIEIVEV